MRGGGLFEQDSGRGSGRDTGPNSCPNSGKDSSLFFSVIYLLAASVPLLSR